LEQASAPVPAWALVREWVLALELEWALASALVRESGQAWAQEWALA